MGVLKQMNLKSTQLTIGFQVKNLFDTTYQMVQGRAMPGRELKLTINFFL